MHTLRYRVSQIVVVVIIYSLSLLLACSKSNSNSNERALYKKFEMSLARTVLQEHPISNNNYSSLVFTSALYFALATAHNLIYINLTNRLARNYAPALMPSSLEVLMPRHNTSQLFRSGIFCVLLLKAGVVFLKIEREPSCRSCATELTFPVRGY